MNKKLVIIFSGYNQRAIVAFLRTISKLNIKYMILARDENDPILLTPYAKDNFIIRKEKKLEINYIIKLIEKAHLESGCTSSMIAPSTEALNRFALENIAAFNEINCVIPLVDLNLYKEISDKYSFGKMCNKHGIDTPKEFPNMEDITFPFVAKPKSYFDKNGNIYAPVLIYNEEDKKFFGLNFQIDNFYYQEFVHGQSIYLLYYFHKDGGVSKFSQKNIVQQSNGKSILAAEPTNYHNTNTSELYEKMFKNLGFRGLIMIELKIDGNREIMIEANPRFWGPSQLFVDANVNLFYQYLLDFDFLEESNDNYHFINNEVKYFWFGGIAKSKQKLYFHEGEEDDFFLNLKDWLSIDVYNRKDTIEIFKKELYESN